MMSKIKKNRFIPGLYMTALIMLLIPAGCGKSIENKVIDINRVPELWPDYSDVVLPPNIAPMNFIINEEGTAYRVKIYSGNGRPIDIRSRDSSIRIPARPWRKLLRENKGKKLYFEIYARNNEKKWLKYKTITNTIAGENIDEILVYRKMHPTYVFVNGEMSICSRRLSGFREKVVISNRNLRETCVNCHSFVNNNPDRMLLGLRSPEYGTGTLIVNDGKVDTIKAKFGYTSWHPSGKLAAYSVNNIPMFFHTARRETRNTYNIDSMLAYYIVDTGKIKTVPGISRKKYLENWPCWSADGRYLYFCNAPVLESENDEFPPKKFKGVRYDLMRIGYDLDNDRWGKTEMVISSEDTGLSIGIPRVSPDGRWLSMCMFDYGYFPSWQEESDLYMLDLHSKLENGKYDYHRLNLNSAYSESWHSWSSNSRWLVFSSKRSQGIFTRTYIGYINSEGSSYKPFVLPQKDPFSYKDCLYSYNVPELITKPVRFSREELIRGFRENKAKEVDISVTMASPKEKKKGIRWQGQRE